MSVELEHGSFRDPGGFVFYDEGRLYRQVQQSSKEDYDLLLSSGLYKTLTERGLLVRHEEIQDHPNQTAGAYRILKPEVVPFISYPYEWCFSQLQDAALATLEIQQIALKHGMSLKDASAYNLQFLNGRAIFIDTLSFEKTPVGKPWIAYRQFCQHFLAPLALMSRTDIRLIQLTRTNLDGVPLDLASKLLPKKTWLNAGLLTHIHLHGAAQKRFEGESQSSSAKTPSVSETALLGLLDSLETVIRKLVWRPYGTTWGDYYQETNYSVDAMDSKKRAVREMLGSVVPTPKTVWDLGANTGVFSKIASQTGANVISWDIDPAAVEKNYLDCKASSETRISPLMIDLTNPSPDQGWGLRERRAFSNRGKPDCVMALALIHHLAIGNNVPLERISDFFLSLGEWLIVEFVPKSDSQTKRLLAAREDIFTGYEPDNFERVFATNYEIVRKHSVAESERTLYLMRARSE